MSNKPKTVDPSELQEVARLVRQAASVIDQLLVINGSIDLAAAHAVTHYRGEATSAQRAIGMLTSQARDIDRDQRQLIQDLSDRVRELEALTETQLKEIKALRRLVWPEDPALKA